MKKILTIFFVTLGVIFFLLLVTVAYLYITDPFNLKPLLFQSSAISTSEEVGVTEVHDSNPVLNESQETALEAIGIDPSSVPTSVTPAQEACFVALFGSARVEEIKAGALPTPLELLQGRGCLE